MSHPAIYIEHQGRTHNVPPRYTPLDHPEICFGITPAAPGSHGAVFRISHTPYGFRNSEIRIRKPGYRKSSWCGIFPLDHDGDGAVGCARQRERTTTMKLQEIKDAVLAGKTVHWKNRLYRVVHDCVGQWLIVCPSTKGCWGLTWADGVTMNGHQNDFFIGEN